MKNKNYTRFILSGLLICLFVVSCSPNVEKPVSTAAPEATLVQPTEKPTSTSVPPTLTDVPTEIPPTDVPPTPTPLPTEISYKTVIPIDVMESKIPWLPLDKSEVPGSAYLAFNLNNGLFKNKEARSALAAATDKETVLQMATKYYEVDPRIATSLTPPQVLGVDLTNVVGISYDPQKAKESLVKAGYKEGNEKPEIRFLVWVSGTREGYRYLLAKELAKMWQENLGVKTEIKTTSTPLTNQSKDDWDIYMVIWGADVNDPDNFLGELFTGGKQMNVSDLRSSSYDSLIKQAASNKNPAERQEIYIKAEKLLCEDYIALVPLYTVKNFKR